MIFYSHRLVDRQTLAAARALDLKYATPEELKMIDIWGAGIISRIAKKLSLRQQVTATAIVYLRRFYLRNSYCETEPSIVMAACVYLAAKTEETPSHIKNVFAEAKSCFNEQGLTNFPTDPSKLAEMEFYLLEDLEFDLIIYHPYKTLLQITGRDTQDTQRKVSEIDDSILQMAWFVINDTYRTQLTLVYPPYVIAIASIYLGMAIHKSRELRYDGNGKKKAPYLTGSSASAAALALIEGETILEDPTSSTAASNQGLMKQIKFLASLNVQMEQVTEVIQELVSLYTFWNFLEKNESNISNSNNNGNNSNNNNNNGNNGNLTNSSNAPSFSPNPQNSRNRSGATSENREVECLRRMRAERDMDLLNQHQASATTR